MNRIFKNVILLIIAGIMSSPLLFAQSSLPEIKVDLVKFEKDDQGTDVRNMYTINVSFADETFQTAETVNILCSIDGIADIEFKDKAIPFSFSRDFRGLATGKHDLKIEIENKSREIDASKKVSFSVE